MRKWGDDIRTFFSSYAVRHYLPKDHEDSWQYIIIEPEVSMKTNNVSDNCENTESLSKQTIARKDTSLEELSTAWDSTILKSPLKTDFLYDFLSDEHNELKRSMQQQVMKLSDEPCNTRHAYTESLSEAFGSLLSQSESPDTKVLQFKKTENEFDDIVKNYNTDEALLSEHIKNHADETSSININIEKSCKEKKRKNKTRNSLSSQNDVSTEMKNIRIEQNSISQNIENNEPGRYMYHQRRDSMTKDLVMPCTDNKDSEQVAIFVPGMYECLSSFIYLVGELALLGITCIVVDYPAYTSFSTWADHFTSLVSRLSSTVLPKNHTIHFCGCGLGTLLLGYALRLSPQRTEYLFSISGFLDTTNIAHPSKDSDDSWSSSLSVGFSTFEQFLSYETIATSILEYAKLEQTPCYENDMEYFLTLGNSRERAIRIISRLEMTLYKQHTQLPECVNVTNLVSLNASVINRLAQEQVKCNDVYEIQGGDVPVITNYEHIVSFFYLHCKRYGQAENLSEKSQASTRFSFLPRFRWKSSEPEILKTPPPKSSNKLYYRDVEISQQNINYKPIDYSSNSSYTDLISIDTCIAYVESLLQTPSTSALSTYSTPQSHLEPTFDIPEKSSEINSIEANWYDNVTTALYNSIFLS